LLSVLALNGTAAGVLVVLLEAPAGHQIQWSSR
jgi:hypothetical protein